MLRHCLLAIWACACITAWAAVDVNLAPAEDLKTFKGIGPKTSAMILEARADKPFHNWEDLIRRIKGIGPKTAEKLSRQGLTVNGERYQTLPQVPAAAPRTHVPREGAFTSR